MKRFSTAVLVALAAAVLPAQADYDEDWRACEGEEPEYSLDQQIAGCTGVINSGRASKSRLSKAHKYRGMAYTDQFKVDRAIQDFDEAIKLNPDDSAAYHYRAWAYYLTGQIDQAIRDYDEAIRLSPGEAEAYVNRGLARCMREFDGALEDFAKGIKLEPNANNYFGRSHCYKRHQQYDRAIADLDRVVELEPKNASFRSARAETYAAAGDFARAIEDYSAAIRLQPGNPLYFGHRGDAHFGLGQYERAFQDYDQAIKLGPNNSWLGYLFRCRAYLRKGGLAEFDQAIADCEHALKLDPALAAAKSYRDEARAAKEALLAQANAAATGARVALIIGNSVYLNAPRLPNARNDVEDVANELKKLGYRVFGFPETDFTRSGMILEIEAFKKASIGSAAAVVWYSGHGQQMVEDGADFANDFVIPIDAKIDSRADVARNAIRLDTLKTAVLAAKRLRMVVIDACRNNPFYTGERASRGMGRSPPTQGVLLIQSTQPGNVAQDGDSRNSPFAKAFLAEIRKGAKRDVRQLFSAVQGGTMGFTRNEQKPQIDDGLATGDTVALLP